MNGAQLVGAVREPAAVAFVACTLLAPVAAERRLDALGARVVVAGVLGLGVGVEGGDAQLCRGVGHVPGGCGWVKRILY